MLHPVFQQCRLQASLIPILFGTTGCCGRAGKSFVQTWTPYSVTWLQRGPKPVEPNCQNGAGRMSPKVKGMEAGETQKCLLSARVAVIVTAVVIFVIFIPWVLGLIMWLIVHQTCFPLLVQSWVPVLLIACWLDQYWDHGHLLVVLGWSSQCPPYGVSSMLFPAAGSKQVSLVLSSSMLRPEREGEMGRQSPGP